MFPWLQSLKNRECISNRVITPQNVSIDLEDGDINDEDAAPRTRPFRRKRMTTLAGLFGMSSRRYNYFFSYKDKNI